MNLKAKPCKIRNSIVTETGKRLRPQDLCNAKYHFKGFESEIEEPLRIIEEFKVKDPNAFVRMETDKNPLDDNDDVETVKSIFIQPSHCAVLFQKYGSLILIDCTFNLTSNDWVVLTICVIDNFPDTKLVAFALLEHEATDSLESVLRLFQEANPDSEIIIRYCMIKARINSSIFIISFVYFNCQIMKMLISHFHN